jgi:hypothetical protein
VDLGGGKVGLVGGDCVKSDGLNETNASDYYQVSLATNNGAGFTSPSYIVTDISVTGNANSDDHDLSSTNNDNLYFSTIP